MKRKEINNFAFFIKKVCLGFGRADVQTTQGITQP